MVTTSLSEDGTSSFSQSDGSLISNYKKRISEKRQTFETMDLIFTSLGCALPMTTFHFYSFTTASILHFLVIFISIVIPCIHMQLVMGQYTHLIISKIGLLCPLIKGLEFSFVMCNILRVISYLLKTSDAIIYLLNILLSELPWTVCPKNSRDYCWDTTMTCDTKPCINDSVHLSAFVYYVKVYLEVNPEEQGLTNIKLELPSIRAIFFILAVCIGVYVGVLSSLNNFKKIVLALSYIVMVAGIALFIHLVVIQNLWLTFAELFTVDWQYVQDYKSWTEAVMLCVEIFGLGRGLYIIVGKYIPAKDSASVFSVLYMTVAIIWITILSSIEFGSLILLNKLTGTTENFKSAKNGITHARFFTYASLFTVMPQAFAELPLERIALFLYLTVIILISFMNVVFIIYLLEKCITDNFPRMMRYKPYTIGLICFLVYLVLLVLSPSGMFSMENLLCEGANVSVEMSNLLFLTATVTLIYRISRFSDDIHFFMGSQPAIYWKVSWTIIPGLLVYPLISYTFIDIRASSKNEKIIWYVTHFILFSPFFVCILYKTVVHIKNHNLVGLFMPQERWGPMDPDERQIRRLFNPRKEIKCRRRHEQCQHACLIMNKVIKRVIEMESKAREEVEKKGFGEFQYEQIVDDTDMQNEIDKY